MIEQVVVPVSVVDIKKIFCGCVDPVKAWNTVKFYLEQYNITDDWTKRTLKLETGEQLILAYLLCHLGLTEHGGSVGGSWTTDKGKAALEFLAEWGTDVFEAMDDRRYYLKFVDENGKEIGD